ncbi:MAG: peroxide stress protein YaaA [Eubacteriales bacterium]|nr:peroxide stress protein YaaA [Eubacteriales bacterium]
MKIIISPAKKMNIDTDTLPVKKLPRFLDDAKVLCREIRKLSFEEAKQLWKCNDRLAELNYERFRNMNLERSLTPAVLSYEGLQYQHMAPGVFSERALEYIGEHLRILSGFYGMLEPFDGVTPYRLEMQAKLSVRGTQNLYDYWGDRLYRELVKEKDMILNLASKEYSKVIEKYLAPEDGFITVEFGELMAGRVKQKGTLAKMARGEMVRFMAENQVQEAEELKKFRALGFKYNEGLSCEDRMVFVAD